MSRSRGSKCSGGKWLEADLDVIFVKAEFVSGSGRSQVRRDKCGARIRRGLHGQTVEQGWEVDHIQPCANGGTDHLDNLQPLHWQNNRAKGDGSDSPSLYCEVTR